ncbi:MAG: hypothetical protein J6O54_07860 [Prevotella sp.]|nr:hypothetical protein [Prevotella sp.]
MATRSVIRIIPSNQSGQGSNQESAPKYIHLYHHWDGSPSGVGRELECFLCGRNDGNDANGMPTWDGERIAEELLHDRQGYVESNGNHGDVEYGYEIDCATRKLTCYDLEFGRRSIGNANVIKM